MAKPDEQGEIILETPYWLVILLPNQVQLGYCVVTLKRRDCGDLADVTTDELVDFHLIAKKLEDALRKAFDATMFNWSCLMNLAYQNTPPDPHVHWHFRPRYNHKVEFAGKTFEDPCFGQHYQWPQVDRIVDDQTRKAIAEHMKKFLL